MAFRFVHTADIHLDSPLRSLALRNPELAELVGDASRQALITIIDLCLAERVDALVIAGDLYDGDQTSMKTARFLAAQMARLHQAGVRVYMIRGNHDAMSRITKQLILPDTVTIFGGRCQSVIQPGAGVDVAFHGLSFASPKRPKACCPNMPYSKREQRTSASCIRAWPRSASRLISAVQSVMARLQEQTIVQYSCRIHSFTIFWTFPSLALGRLTCEADSRSII